MTPDQKENKCCDTCKIHISCGIEAAVEDGFGYCTCKGNGCWVKEGELETCHCHKEQKEDKIYLKRHLGSDLVMKYEIRTPSSSPAPENWAKSISERFIYMVNMGITEKIWTEEERTPMMFVLRSILEDVEKALAKEREGVIEEILKKVEDYKVPRGIKANPTDTDFIFIYDLKTFILAKLSKEKKDE